jgi:hypothetical protein
MAGLKVPSVKAKSPPATIFSAITRLSDFVPLSQQSKSLSENWKNARVSSHFFNFLVFLW